MDDETFLEVAIEQARIGRRERGVPLDEALVVDGDIGGLDGQHIRHNEICILRYGRVIVALMIAGFEQKFYTYSAAMSRL